MRGTQRGRPALSQIVKIRFTGLGPIIEFGVVGVAAGDQNIKRQPDERMVEMDARAYCAKNFLTRSTTGFGVP
jgi:hypothetical protein